MIKRKKGERKVLAKKEKNRKRKNWIMRAELKNVRDLRKVCEGERRVEFYLKLEQTGTIYQTFQFSQLYAHNSMDYKLKSQSKNHKTVICV